MALIRTIDIRSSSCTLADRQHSPPDGRPRQPSRANFPHIRPQGVREAIASALGNEDRECAATHWADALSSSGAARDWGGVRFGNACGGTWRMKLL